MAKALPKLACALLAFAMLGQKTTAQSLFAKAKEDSNKSLEVYVSTLRDYFSRWSSLLVAAPEEDENGKPVLDVNPVERFLRFRMRVSINETTYSEWKTNAFQQLAQSGISQVDEGGILIGGKSWAFPNRQGIEAWIKDAEMPKMTFRAMLVDANGAIVKSAEFHDSDVYKCEIDKTEHGAMLRSWANVKTNSVSTIPLCWFGRMKDDPSFEMKNWQNKKQDKDSCFINVEFNKLTDEEMERAASVKCVVLDENDIQEEHIMAAWEKWREREDEAKAAVLQILANMVKVPGQDYALGRYEVRQYEWEAIMEGNPVKGDVNLGPNKPAIGAGFDDVKEFIVRLTAYPAIRDSGIRFRLPAKEEWMTACLAGSSGDFGLLSNGKEGTLAELGWYFEGDDTRSSRNNDFVHEVGTKQPNAWGFYDMHGNAWERIAKKDGKIAMGGGYQASARACTASSVYEPGWRGWWSEKDDKSAQVGFRLCADWSEALENAIGSAKAQLDKVAVLKDSHTIIQSIVDGLVAIPGTDVMLGKFEVTQLQWETLMGKNQSLFRGAKRPVDNITEADVKMFLEKLNAAEEVVAAGLRFRLPTKEEWTTAALAGGMTERTLNQKYSSGEISREERNTLLDKLIGEDRKMKKAYGLLADGSEGKPDDVAWHDGDSSNAKGMTHPVGKKASNAFGFFDMCGNVAEVVTRDNYLHPYIAMGGSWESSPDFCSVESESEYDVWMSGRVGIRLCAERNRASEVNAPENDVLKNEQSNLQNNGLRGKTTVVLDVIDIVAKSIRDKANAEQLIRNKLSEANPPYDVVIRADGIKDDYVRGGNANDVIREFTLYLRMHYAEITKKAFKKIDLE